MFYIKESEGVKFAKLSGDNNVVHFDKIAGNNSIYGYKVVHGVLVILKFLRKIKLTKNYSCIKVQFQKGFEYNSEIRIKEIKKEIMLLHVNKKYLEACKHCNGRDHLTPKIEPAVQTKRPLPIPIYLE